MYLSPPSSYFNKASWNRILFNFLDPAIRLIASTKPHRPLLAILQSFPSSKTLFTLWIDVDCVWVQIYSQGMTMGEGRKRCYNDFSLRRNSSLSKRWVCVCCKKPIWGFLSKWPFLHLLVMRVYIVWVKNKKITYKNPPSKMFHDYLAKRSYPRDTREIDNLAQFFNFQSCASHMATSRVSFSRASREIHLIFN